MSEYIVSVPDEAAEYFIARFGLDGTKMMGYDLTGENIRCRDCRRFHPSESSLLACRFELDNGLVQWRYAEPDGFCKWGERKSEDD